jgi:hypothetical protein
MNASMASAGILTARPQRTLGNFLLATHARIVEVFRFNASAACATVRSFIAIASPQFRLFTMGCYSSISFTLISISKGHIRKYMNASPWLRDPALADLKLILYLLNGEGELPPYFPQPKVVTPAILGVQPELRRLVEAWKGAGFNAKRLLEMDSFIAKRLQRMTVRLIPTPAGRFRLERPILEQPQRKEGPTQAEQWQDFAFDHFINLLLNPYCERLAGPCARCKLYFLKKRVDQKVYCSRRCDKAAGAAAATRKRLDKQRADKLNLARGIASRWKKARTELDWKTWVTENEPALTKTFLTQAVNRRELRPPKKGK